MFVFGVECQEGFFKCPSLSPSATGKGFTVVKVDGEKEDGATGKEAEKKENV